jgi:thiosulfate sulfurtransferase
MAIIILLGTGTGLVFNYFSSNGIPLINNSYDFSTPDELSVEQAYATYRQGSAIFIDTRYPEEFEQGHIRQAVNVPAKWSMDQVMNYFASLNRNQHLIIYCNRGCTSSLRLAGFLSQQEFRKVSVLAAGFEAWLSRDYPVEATTKRKGQQES